MRWLLALLVLANAFAFALFQGWLSPWVRGDREPQRLIEQRNPERLRVVPLDRLGAGSARSPGSAPSSPASAAATPAAPGASQPAATPERRPDAPAANGGPERGAASRIDAAAADAASVCVAFGPLDEQRANRLRDALEAAGARVESTRSEQAASYLVYVPPLDSFADAQRRMADLRRIGQNDVFVMQDGSLRLGISVGLFRSEETARALVTRLEGLGETGLRIASRGAVTVRVRLQARWSDSVAASAASALAARFDTQPRDCG